nr:NAD-dependent DNA ligase LigA [Mycoplasma buteonis]
MITEDTKITKKMKELIAKINRWNDEYYNQDNPTVSDQEYDITLRELESLENQYPHLILSDTPTLKIGGMSDKKFTKYTHTKPMLSLAKAYSLAEVEKFLETNFKEQKKNLSYTLEPKIDGLSIALHYQEGQLVKAVTRGDGKIGEDVTENVYQIRSIPKRINYLKRIEIRGEVYLSKANFDKLNAELSQNEQKLFANPRNAASGTLRQLDPQIVAYRQLDALMYDIVSPEEHHIYSQKEVYETLLKWGFLVHPYFALEDEVENILTKVSDFIELKNDFVFDCDGLVIKVNDITLWDKLGKTAKFPKYAIAFKYETEEAISTITKIEATVGRTGKITYVAEIAPVTLNQTTVSKATLHNYEYIQMLNLNIGDDIKIIKSGEIIPKIIALVNKNSVGVFEKVDLCPSCQSNLVKIDENVDQFCVNELCVEKQIRSLIHFVSRQAFNIKTLGENILRLFYSNGYISDFVSIFELKKYESEILKLRSFKEKKTQNILNNIEEAKKIELYKVLYAIGIKHIGLQVAQLICQKLTCLSDLSKMNLNELEFINTIGEKIIFSLKEFVSEPKNIDLLQKLDRILTYEKTTQNSDKLSNKIFVITGTLSQSRDYFKDLIVKNDGKIASSVSKNTTYLLAGKEAGSKLTKAQNLGIKILSEEEFNDLLNK